MSPILPHTRQRIAELIITDLAAGQSAADSIAGRIRISAEVIDQICRGLLESGHLGIRHISISNRPDLPVYHIPDQLPPTNPS
jgi:hypothetical protein